MCVTWFLQRESIVMDATSARYHHFHRVFPPTTTTDKLSRSLAREGVLASATRDPSQIAARKGLSPSDSTVVISPESATRRPWVAMDLDLNQIPNLSRLLIPAHSGKKERVCQGASTDDVRTTYRWTDGRLHNSDSGDEGSPTGRRRGIVPRAQYIRDDARGMAREGLDLEIWYIDSKWGIMFSLRLKDFCLAWEAAVLADLSLPLQSLLASSLSLPLSSPPYVPHASS